MAASSTSVVGFKFARSISGVSTTPGTFEFIIEDSATVTLGDAVRVDTNGLVKRAATGTPLIGICVGLVDQNGINVFSPRASGTTGATLTPDDTLAVSSTNSSDGTRKLKAQVALDPGGSLLWSNVASAALAQTNVGQFFDVTSNSGQIDQATASDTSGQFQLIVLDPNGDGTLTDGLFRIVENQLVVNVNSYNSSAVITA